jgi:hypothetical protein
LRRFIKAEQLYYDSRQKESIGEYKAIIKSGLDVSAVYHRLGLALEDMERFE